MSGKGTTKTSTHLQSSTSTVHHYALSCRSLVTTHVVVMSSLVEVVPAVTTAARLHRPLRAAFDMHLHCARLLPISAAHQLSPRPYAAQMPFVALAQRPAEASPLGNVVFLGFIIVNALSAQTQQMPSATEASPAVASVAFRSQSTRPSSSPPLLSCLGVYELLEEIRLCVSWDANQTI